MPRAASIDHSKSTFREMQAPVSRSTYEDGVPHSRLSFSSTASAYVELDLTVLTFLTLPPRAHPGEVRAFDDPEGFTSCIIVEDVEPKDVFAYVCANDAAMSRATLMAQKLAVEP